MQLNNLLLHLNNSLHLLKLVSSVSNQLQLLFNLLPKSIKIFQLSNSNKLKDLLKLANNISNQLQLQFNQLPKSIKIFQLSNSKPSITKLKVNSQVVDKYIVRRIFLKLLAINHQELNLSLLPVSQFKILLLHLIREIVACNLILISNKNSKTLDKNCFKIIH